MIGLSPINGQSFFNAIEQLPMPVPSDPMPAPYVFSLDINFVEPFKVLLFSLRDTLSLSAGDTIYVLHDTSIDQSKRNQLALYAAAHSVVIEFIDIAPQLSLLPPLREGSHVTQLCFARLFIASVLPNAAKSALCIDADTLAVGDISDLLDLRLSQPIAACDHCSAFDQLRIHGERGGSYFQSGLILVNLEYWRQANIQNEFNQVISNSYDQLLWWDQDVLNIVFKDKWQRLPVSYNFCRSVRESLVNPQYTVSLQPRLLHYDGGNKPWIVYRNDHFGALWYEAFNRAFGYEHPLLAQQDSSEIPPPSSVRKLYHRFSSHRISHFLSSAISRLNSIRRSG